MESFQFKDRVGLISLALLTLVQVSLCQLDSQFSAHLGYNMSDFSKETLVPFGHEMPLDLFRIIKKPGGEPDIGTLNLEINVPKGLLMKGTFRKIEVQNNTSQLLQFNPMNDSEASRSSHLTRGSVDDLNTVLASLTFFRNSTVELKTDFEVNYSIFNDDDKTKKDSVSQKLVCLKGLKIEQLANKSSITVYQDEAFEEDLLMVMENKALFRDLGVRMHPSSTTADFVVVTMNEGLVRLAGVANWTAGDPQLDKGNPYRLSFAVHDAATGVYSETFTFYLQVALRDAGQSDRLKLLLVVGLLLLLALLLLVCAVVSVRRDKKQLKEQVKQAMQQDPVVAENVLTKSILEWNKEATSTRDQSHKDSLLYNPYDKYSLKKRTGDKGRPANYGQVTTTGSRASSSRSGGQVVGSRKQSPDDRPANSSKLEFSRHDDADDKAAGPAFGDEFSQITGEKLDSEEGDKREADARLEDIILRDFN